MLSNNSMQRTALRAAADAGRWPFNRALAMNRDDLVRDTYAHFGLAVYQAQVLEV